MNVFFDHSEDLTPHIKSFWFKPEQPVQFTAGQFTELYLPHSHADERGDKRWFTISSSPGDSLISITTKFSPDNGSSFKQALLSLSPGTAVHMAEPMGDFVLPKSTAQPLVFIGVGIGITPIHSIARWLLATGERRQIQVLYAVSTPDDLVLTAPFQTGPIAYTPIIKHADAAREDMETGALTAARILALTGDSQGKLFYLSGPEIVVEALTKELATLGVDNQRIITDYFHGYLNT